MDSRGNIKDMCFVCLFLQGKLLTFKIGCNVNNIREVITIKLIILKKSSRRPSNITDGGH